MPLESVIDRVLEELPGCLAVGYVDGATGMLLTARGAEVEAEALFEEINHATVDLFERADVQSIERMLEQSSPEDRPPGALNEVIMFASEFVHYFVRDTQASGSILAAVCRKSANLGLVVTRGRSALGRLREALA